MRKFFVAYTGCLHGQVKGVGNAIVTLPEGAKVTPGRIKTWEQDLAAQLLVSNAVITFFTELED